MQIGPSPPWVSKVYLVHSPICSEADGWNCPTYLFTPALASSFLARGSRPGRPSARPRSWAPWAKAPWNPTATSASVRRANRDRRTIDRRNIFVTSLDLLISDMGLTRSHAHGMASSDDTNASRWPAKNARDRGRAAARNGHRGGVPPRARRSGGTPPRRPRAAESVDP